jgi:ATP-dependent helicase YprA (DUF1998 family)
MGSYLDPMHIYYFFELYYESNARIQCDAYDGDQRSIWTDFRNDEGVKNPSNWIHSTRDCVNESSQLIGHANNLGLNSLWFFIGSDGNPDNIGAFCNAAWQNGWLKKYIRKWYDIYECTCPDGCTSWPPGGCWTYVRSESTNIVIQE